MKRLQPIQTVQEDGSLPNNIAFEQSIRNRILGIFDKLYNQFSFRAPDTFFDHWLEFILWNWNIEPKPIPDWPYSISENRRFLEATRNLALALSDMLRIKPWYDAFGEIYETRVASHLRKHGKGQYFTPMNVAECMAALVDGDYKDKDVIVDPCCGSGRLILAAHELNPKATFVAVDLDRTCCMMAAVNFLLHGCRGKVVHGNSLNLPDNIEDETWYINPNLGTGMPLLNQIPHLIKP